MDYRADDVLDEDDADQAIGDRLVNRQVLFIIPQKPYIDWANSHAGSSGTSYRPDRTGTAYLIPLFDEDEHTESYVAQHFDSFFAEELSAWELDETKWPAPRSFELFLQWFDARIAPLVFDAGTGPIHTLDNDDSTEDDDEDQ